MSIDNPSDELEISTRGKVLQRLLFDRPPTYGLLQTYNNFVEDILPKQIEANPYPVEDRIVRFKGVEILPPYHTVGEKTYDNTPIKSRLHKTSYMCEIRSHVYIYDAADPDGSPLEQTENAVTIGHVPCMVRSNKCNLHNKSVEKLTAMGEDYRDPGGYYIIDGIERLTFLSDMLAINRYRFGTDPKSGNQYATIIAETVRGTMMTTLRVIQNKNKKELQTSHFKLMLNNIYDRSMDKTKKNINNRAINIFKVIRYYAYMVQERFGDQTDAYLAFDNPYDILELILLFVKKDRRSAVTRALADTVLDAFCFRDEASFMSRVVLSGLPEDQRTEKRGHDAIVHCLDSSILSHLDPMNPMNKILNICMMIAMLAEYSVGLRNETDRDSWTNKRLTTSAKKCEQLFRGFFKTVVTKSILAPYLPKANRKPRRLTMASLLREISKHSGWIGDQYISSFKGARYGLNTVNVKTDNPVQMLLRGTFMELQANLNRVDIIGLSRNTKSLLVRSLNPSYWGFLGPAETTENSGIGIVKTKAITSQPTVPGDSSKILDVLEGKIAYSVDDKMVKKGLYILNEKINGDGDFDDYEDKLLIDGNFIGWCNGGEVRQAIISSRRAGSIYRDTSVVFDKNNAEVYIHLDESRLSRPLFVVENNVLLVEEYDMWDAPYQEMVQEGVIEYIDAFEQSYCRIATEPEKLQKWQDDLNLARTMLNEGELEEDDAKIAQAHADIKELLDNKFTHMEIHEAATYGVSISIMPFLNFNQAPRVTYQSKMGAQAIGTHHINHANRFDNDAKVMLRPTVPLVSTQIEKTLGLDLFPQGLNLHLAFLNIKGDTQEDAFILKDTVAELGYMSTMYYLVVEVEINASTEELMRPEPHRGEDPDRYRFLTKQGLPMIGAPLNQGDYVVGRVRFDKDAVTKSGVRGVYKNTSVPLKIGEYGVVDSVYVTKGTHCDRVLIKLRRDRRHQIGDKLSSRYAQKGTTSRIVSAADLPFDINTGETADIYVNIHSMSKRMTIGYILEALFGLLSALTGKRYDASAFKKHNVEDIYRELERRGFGNKGYRWLVNPDTGTKFKAMVFSGPVYIQMLHHFGPEKLQVRASGAVKLLTRQPPRGTGFGGRRIGEMERNAMIAHGASEFLIERLIKMSDAYTPGFCRGCGNFAVVSPQTGSISCTVCEEGVDPVRTEIPFIYKLMTQLLMGALIYMRLDYGKVTTVEEERDVEKIIGEDDEEEGEEEEDDFEIFDQDNDGLGEEEFYDGGVGYGEFGEL